MMDEELIKRIHATELEILDVVVKVCEDNDISYFLGAGSMLGAIRHKGIIPWDDDIDLVMLREDYERFLQIAPSQLPKGYALRRAQKDDPVPILFCKVEKEGTLCACEEWYANGCPIGFVVDIFPYDYVYDDPARRDKQAKWALWYDNMLVTIFEPGFHVLVAEHGGAVGMLDRALCWSLRHVRSLRQVVLRKHHALATRVKGSEWLANLSERQGFRRYYRTEWVFPLRRVEFEGRMLPVPHECERWLEERYGDYMTPPPPEQRVAHDITHLDFGA